MSSSSYADFSTHPLAPDFLESRCVDLLENLEIEFSKYKGFVTPRGKRIGVDFIGGVEEGKGPYYIDDVVRLPTIAKIFLRCKMIETDSLHRVVGNESYTVGQFVSANKLLNVMPSSRSYLKEFQRIDNNRKRERSFAMGKLLQVITNAEPSATAMFKDVKTAMDEYTGTTIPAAQKARAAKLMHLVDPLESAAAAELEGLWKTLSEWREVCHWEKGWGREGRSWLASKVATKPPRGGLSTGCQRGS